VKKISQSKYLINTQNKRFSVIPQNERLYSYNLQEDLYLEQFSRKNTTTISSKKKFFSIKTSPS
jgi:hypothetical protein